MPWLKTRTPVAKIGYSIYLYDLTGDPEAHMSLARTYLRVGPERLAIPELRRVLSLQPENPEVSRLLADLEARSGS